jgi:hypothetical protein
VTTKAVKPTNRVPCSFASLRYSHQARALSRPEHTLPLERNEVAAEEELEQPVVDENF